MKYKTDTYIYLPGPAARENPNYRLFSRRAQERLSEKGVMLGDLLPNKHTGPPEINLEAGRRAFIS